MSEQVIAAWTITEATTFEAAQRELVRWCVALEHWTSLGYYCVEIVFSDGLKIYGASEDSHARALALAVDMAKRQRGRPELSDVDYLDPWERRRWHRAAWEADAL